MILEKMKVDSMTLRRARDPMGAFSATVLGKVLELAKADTKGGVTPDLNDDYALRAIRTFLKTATENVELKSGIGADFSKDAAEAKLLNSWLPAVIGEDVLKAEIAAVVDTLPEKSVKSMGLVMKTLKEKLGATMDPQLASKLVREALAS